MTRDSAEEPAEDPNGKQNHVAGAIAVMRPMELLQVAMELPRTDPVVVLREIDPPHRLLRFPVGWCEGLAISYALRGISTPRPLTHESFATALSSFGVSLEVVRITALAGRTLLGEMVFSGAGQRKQIDCRPSDALALMLRQPLSIPLVVSIEILELLGELADTF